MPDDISPVPPVVKKAADQRAGAVPEAKGASLKVLLGAAENMPTFHIREFTLEPGGRIPEHVHDSIEHGQLMLEGEMTISLGGEIHKVREGDGIFIPPRVPHWYENRTKSLVRFVCVIPAVKEYATKWTGG